MTQLTNVELAAIEKAALNFFRVHPDLRLEANKNLLLDYMEDNMLSPAIAENWEIALLASYDRLGKRAKVEEPVRQVESEPEPQHGPPAFNDPFWTPERLREAIRNENPRAVEQKVPVLPLEITARTIKKMDATEFRALKKKIAVEHHVPEYLVSQAITNRVQGVN